MPVVTIDYQDLVGLLGESVSQEELLKKIPMMGADIDRVNGTEMAIEFFPDRPDLLSVEGIARSLRSFLGMAPGMHHYHLADPSVTLTVDRSVKAVRPIIGAAVVRNVRMSEALVRSMMDLQEKLHLSVGKERTKVAIGLHNLDAVTPPFTYKAVKPTEVSFVPLNETVEMTLNQILQRHEKGIKYAHILAGKKRYPVIVDAHHHVLSFPPIINGELTAVDLFTENLFVDVTGTQEQAVTAALNIITTALAERGGEVEAVSIKDQPPRVTPDFSPQEWRVDLAYASRLLGFDTTPEAEGALRKMGFDAQVEEGEVVVQVPPWRSDILHPVDLVEDLAIGYGYQRFTPRLPRSMTFGHTLSWQPLHDTLVGLGFNEVVSLSLSSQEEEFERMRQKESEAVRIANPLTTKHTLVRVSLLPSLLEILSKNRHHQLPQMLYEVGEVVWLRGGEAENVTLLTGVKIDARAGFTECKSLVEAVLRNLGVDAETTEREHPSFIPGRCAALVKKDGQEMGYFGEVHPAVIASFDLEYPVIAFEMQASALRPSFEEKDYTHGG